MPFLLPFISFVLSAQIVKPPLPTLSGISIGTEKTKVFKVLGKPSSTKKSQFINHYTDKYETSIRLYYHDAEIYITDNGIPGSRFIVNRIDITSSTHRLNIPIKVGMSLSSANAVLTKLYEGPEYRDGSEIFMIQYSEKYAAVLEIHFKFGKLTKISFWDAGC